ncbi:DUF4236 domain-containing protein [Aliidiomarina taiwanensis]|nr:DUF4236 domain-containing protein [Aliidiomarina taiwanensis]
MAFRFHRRITLFPGVRLNLGKTGVSVSAGVRGATVTAGKRGVHGNVGLPGTGLSYRKRLDKPVRVRSSHGSGRTNNGATTEQLTLSLDERGQLLVHSQTGEPVDTSVRRALWQHYAGEITDFLHAECERINNDTEALLHIHADTPPLATPSPSYQTQAYRVAPPSLPALPDLPEAPMPPRRYFWLKLFPGVMAKRERDFEQAYQHWQQALQAITEQRAALEHTFQQALEGWQANKQQHQQQQKQAAERFHHQLRHCPDTMTEQLEQALAALSWPRQTHISFELTQQAEHFHLNLDVDLPTGAAFPKQSANLSKTGRRLLMKDKSARQQRMEYARHVHGVVFKIAGVSFVTLPNLHNLTIAAYTQRLNEATGFTEDTYLLEVDVTREQWQQLNLTDARKIDPIAALELFSLNRNMTKTGIFKPIKC